MTRHFPRARLAYLLLGAAVSFYAMAPPLSAARVVERGTFGTSVDDVALEAMNIGARSSSTRILVVGCIHGNECAGKAVVRELKQMERTKRFELWVTWALNPDGAAAGTRQNARGVDLNRNFRTGWKGGGDPWDTYYPGPRPLSEPESRAAVNLIKDLKPDITIWYHQAMELVTKMGKHRATQRRYARRVDLPLVRLDPLPGTATRWQNRKFPGHTAFVVELAAGRLTDSDARIHARAVRFVARKWAFKD